MVRLARLTVLVLMTALAACGESNVSGTYVAKSFGEVAMLELVQTDDGKISGKLTAVAASKGRLQDLNASVSGVTHDEAMSLTIQPTMGPISLSLVTTTMAGTASREMLRLNTDASNGKVQTIEFLRSDISEFETWASSIRETVRSAAEAKAKAAAKAERERAEAEARARLAREEAEARAKVERQRSELLSNIEAFTARVAKFESAAAKMVPKFRDAEVRYRKLTERAEQMLERQRSMPTYARSQVATAIELMLSYGGPMESDRRSAELVEEDFEKATNSMAASAARLAASCQTIDAGDEGASLAMACSALPQLSANYTSAAKTLRTAMDSAARVYKEEADKQKAMQQTAEAFASR